MGQLENSTPSGQQDAPPCTFGQLGLASQSRVFLAGGQAVRVPRGESSDNFWPPCPSSSSGSFAWERTRRAVRILPYQPILQASVVSHPREKVVPPPRFEHGTHRLGICCSILLSYGGTIRMYLSHVSHLSNEYRVVSKALHFLPQTDGNQIAPTGGISPDFMRACGLT